MWEQDNWSFTLELTWSSVTLCIQFKLFSSFQVCHHNHSLEEANEYEYLKNILFQYMMGRESTTLSKVLSAVLKFSPDQQKEIALREEHRQSFLTTFGFRPV